MQQYPPHQRKGSYAEEGRCVHCMKVCIAVPSRAGIFSSLIRHCPHPFCVSPQAGISTSDRLLAVSAGFAEEIQTYLGGWGMEELLQNRAPVINGIINGIDME